MTSFIITGKDPEETQKMAVMLCEKKGIDLFDTTFITSDKDSIGIEVVKKLQEKIILRPLRGKNKAVIIPDAHLLTHAAQNALLKLLEEPPEHTYIYLLCDNPDALLSTIQSRCQIIRIADPTIVLDIQKHQELLDDYHQITKQPIGNALKMAERLAKDKQGCIQYLELFTMGCRTHLLSLINQNDSLENIPRHLTKIQSTITTLKKSNTSARLALEHLFLQLRG